MLERALRATFDAMASELRDKLKGEVMATGFDELVPHFARGGLLLLSADVDLLDAAEAMATDDRARVETWLGRGQLRRASDADAQACVATPLRRFQCVIVQPWVLAQLLPERA